MGALKGIFRGSHNVFKPYFTTKHAYSGTGLGLFMVYEMVKKSFCGVIEVSNERFSFNGNEYQGAKFTISLPLEC